MAWWQVMSGKSKVKGKLSRESAEAYAKKRRRLGKRTWLRRQYLPPFAASPKYNAARYEVYQEALSRGLKHTAGDRTPGENAAVGGVPNSLHLTSRANVWADDYGAAWWTVAGRKKLESFHDWCITNSARLRIIEVPAIDHGTAPHVHVGGTV